MKTNLLKTTLMIVLLAVAAGCNDDLGYTGGAECKGCGGATEVDGSEDPDPKDAADCDGCNPDGGDEINQYPCNGQDIAVTLEVTNIGKGFVDCKTTITNVGTYIAYLDAAGRRIGYDIYLSYDGVYRDQIICGSGFTHNLDPGESDSHSMHCTPDVNPLDYSYVIIDIDEKKWVECNFENNTYVVKI